MYILGIHVGHDASAALFYKTELIGAVQEERFSRIKNYSGYPKQSISYLLGLKKIKENDINHIAVAGVDLGSEIPNAILKARFDKKHNKIAYYFYSIIAIFKNNFLEKVYAQKKVNNLSKMNYSIEGF